MGIRPRQRFWKLAAHGVLKFAAIRAEFLILDAHVHANLDKLRDSPGFPIAVAMRNQARAAMNKLAEQFGLTPASRTRLRVEPSAVIDDPLEELFSHRG